MTSTKRRPFPLSLSPGVTEDFLAALLKTKHSALSYLLRNYQAHHEGQPRAQVWAYSGPLVLQNFTSLPIINQNQRKSGKERKTVPEATHHKQYTVSLCLSRTRSLYSDVPPIAAAAMSIATTEKGAATTTSSSGATRTETSTGKSTEVVVAETSVDASTGVGSVTSVVGSSSGASAGLVSCLAESSGRAASVASYGLPRGYQLLSGLTIGGGGFFCSSFHVLQVVPSTLVRITVACHVLETGEIHVVKAMKLVNLEGCVHVKPTCRG